MRYERFFIFGLFLLMFTPVYAEDLTILEVNPQVLEVEIGETESFVVKVKNLDNVTLDGEVKIVDIPTGLQIVGKTSHLLTVTSGSTLSVSFNVYAETNNTGSYFFTVELYGNSSTETYSYLVKVIEPAINETVVSSEYLTMQEFNLLIQEYYLDRMPDVLDVLNMSKTEEEAEIQTLREEMNSKMDALDRQISTLISEVNRPPTQPAQDNTLYYVIGGIVAVLGVAYLFRDKIKPPREEPKSGTEDWGAFLKKLKPAESEPELSPKPEYQLPENPTYLDFMKKYKSSKIASKKWKEWKGAHGQEDTKNLG